MPVEEETTTVGAGTTQVSHTPDQPDSVCVCLQRYTQVRRFQRHDLIKRSLTNKFMQFLECTGSISDRLLIHLTGKFLIKPDRWLSCRELKIVKAVLVCRKFLSEKNTQAS